MNAVDTTMTAVVCHGPKDYRVQQVAGPKAGPLEMIIRIGACGICASDCKCWSGAKMFWGGASPWVKAPVIPGHEFFGYVETLEAGLSAVGPDRVGDRLAFGLQHVGDDDLGALAREQPRRGGSHPGRRPGDDGNLVLQTHGISSRLRHPLCMAGSLTSTVFNGRS